MKKTKKLTLGAMSIALGILFMFLGNLIEALDLTAVALASLVMVFAYVELGSPYTFGVWLGTSLLGFILPLSKTMVIAYLLVFGFYPMVKGYIERLPRILWWPLKLVFLNLAMAVDLLICEFILGTPFFGDTGDFFGIPTGIVYAIIWILLNLAFIVYDIFILVMSRFYFTKLRPRFKSFLK